MSSELNNTSSVATSEDEKTTSIDTSTKQPLIIKTENQGCCKLINNLKVALASLTPANTGPLPEEQFIKKEGQEGWKPTSNSPTPKLCGLKVVLSRLEAANLVPLPGGVGYSVLPLSAAINPLNKDQVPGVGNYPGRKAKRNGVPLSCCLGCESNSPCKRVRSSDYVKKATKKRNYLKRRAEMENTDHLSVTLSSTCSNTEALIYCTSVSEERAFPVARSIVVEAPNQNASPVGMVQSSQVPACESGLLSCPLHQREVDYDPSFPGTIHGQDLNSGVESARLSTASRSSDVSQPQVSSSSVSVTGSVPVNNTSEVTASSTARLHLPNGLLSATSTGSRPLATRDNSSCRSISGTAFSSAVPRLSSQVNPPSISSAGVMGFGDSLLPVSINSTASSSAVPRLSSQINPPSTSSAGVMAFGDSSLLVPINSTASSSAVPSMTQITPPFISSTGVTSSRQPILPPLPLQLPRMRTCFPGYVSSIPLSLCLPSTGQQTGSPFIPGTHNVVNCAPFYPSRQYPPLCFVNSGQPLSNVLRENTFNSNPLTANDQSFTCFEPQTHPRGDNFGRTWSTEVTTRPNERIATWMTSAGHPKNRDDNGSSIMACHQGHVGTCSSIMGQDKNNVGVRRTSVGRQNDNDGMGNTSMGHQNEPVSTSSGHRRAHVGMSFASIAHPERNVGISSTSIGHQKPDHVSSSTASAEHEKDCVGGGGRSVDYEEDNNTIFTDEAPFSISSLLPELPDEVTSRTAPDVARQRRTTRNNREIVQEACSKLEKALSLISKRDVADYGWLQDRYRDTSLRQTPLITGVRSLKKFIERTELALKIENLQLQKSLHKLKNQINVYETNVRKETIKYEMKNALIEKRSVAKEGRAVKHKEAELEEMLAKIKVLSDEMDTIEMKWLKTEGTMLGFKQFEPGSSHDNGAGQNC